MLKIIRRLWAGIKGLVNDPPLIESVRSREEWYRNEIIQAYENKDYERAARLEGERTRLFQVS